jgi:hypothetical protein
MIRTIALDSGSGRSYVNVRNIHMKWSPMNPIVWLDDIGRPAWIALMIVSFVLFPPAGLVVLGYLLGSGRMGHWTPDRGERWQRRMERMQQRMQQRAARWCGPRAAGGGAWGGGAWSSSGRSSSSGSSTGNAAFDEYRNETLRRLEEEERNFKEFLDRLRRAKDKAEFDQFMAEMRGSSAGNGGGNGGGSYGPEGPMPQPGS